MIRSCWSCLVWVVALSLLTGAWLGSSWPLRALELLIAAVLLVGAATLQGRRKGPAPDR